MTFYDFVIGFINDDTPLGILAQYIENDCEFQNMNEITKLLDRMLCLTTPIINLLKVLIEQ